MLRDALTRFTAKALLILGLTLGLIAARGPVAHAEVRGAAMAIDANTGEVLHEQFADAPRHPASLTKIMTLFLAFREMEKGRLTLTTPVRISERAAGVAPSKLDLDPGEEIQVGDAIKALVTKSANDVAVALAEHIGGSEPGFVRMMNETAAEIGMRGTTFYNASGLPDNRQISTARDMLTLALRLQDEFPQYYRYFSIKSFDYRGKTYRTHNTLMHGVPGMDGIKTGYTKASGFNVVSSVRTDSKHVVAVVFGGATAAARNAHMRMVLYRALQKASTQKTRKPNVLLVARRKAPSRVETGISAMPGEPEPASQTVAAAEAEDAAEAPQAPWKTDTKNAPKAAAAIPKLKASPQPARAQKAPKQDQIAAVIARANAAPATRVVTTTIIAVPPAVAEAPQAAPAPVEAETAPPRLDLHALRAAMTEPEPQPDQPQSPASPGIEQLLANAGATQQPRPPSTLDSQAQALDARTSAKPRMLSDAVFARANAADAPSHLRGPMPEARLAPAPAGKSFEIQIGAYGSAEEAQTRIAAARKRAPGLLDGHEHVAMAVQRGDKQIYRARFRSFSEDSASSACLELRRLAIDCFSMKAD